MHRGAWQTTVHGVAKSRTRLNDYHSLILTMGFPGGTNGIESAFQCRRCTEELKLLNCGVGEDS